MTVFLPGLAEDLRRHVDACYASALTLQSLCPNDTTGVRTRSIAKILHDLDSRIGNLKAELMKERIKTTGKPVIEDL